MLPVVRRTSETRLLSRHISAKGLAVRSSLDSLPYSMLAGPVGSGDFWKSVTYVGTEEELDFFGR